MADLIPAPVARFNYLGAAGHIAGRWRPGYFQPMNKRLKSIYEQARSLTAAEQLELSDILRATAVSDDEIEAAWRDEVADRIASLDRGEARLISAEDVLAKLRLP